MTNKRNEHKIALTPELLSVEILTNKLTINEVAAKYNWSSPTVKKYLKKYNIKHGRRDIRDSLNKEEFYDMYYTKNMTIQEIASKFNTIYIGTIIRQMRDWGISPKIGTFTDKQKIALKARKQHEYLCGSLISKIKSGINQRCKNGRVIELSITLDDIWKQFLKQNKKCALSGIELKFPSSTKEYSKYEWTASVDRIDSKGGYTIDNIQIVHKKINTIKFDLSNEEFIEWCKLVVGHNN